MKIFVNIALLLILFALLALAVTVPRQWLHQEEAATTPPDQTGFVIRDQETEETPPVINQNEAAPKIEPEENEAPEQAPVTPKEILEIVSRMQRGESEQAALLINDALETLDDSDAIALQTIVSAEAAKAEQIEMMASQLDETKKELADLEKSSRKALDESLKTLAIATKRAEEATAESKKRIENLKKDSSSRVATDEESPSEPVPPKRTVKLPDNDLIDFSFGSTFLSDRNKSVLSKAITILKERPELVIQLRGHTDTIGEPQYNATLAKARCEMARDFLIEEGIENHRISIISFGESQVFKEGVVAEKPRRVEILFRTKS